jgi:hypothetical protein
MFCKSLKSDAHPLHTRVCTSMNKLLSHCFKLRDRVESGAMHLRLTQPCMFACLHGLRWVCRAARGELEDQALLPIYHTPAAEVMNAWGPDRPARLRHVAQDFFGDGITGAAVDVRAVAQRWCASCHIAPLRCLSVCGHGSAKIDNHAPPATMAESLRTRQCLVSLCHAARAACSALQRSPLALSRRKAPPSNRGCLPMNSSLITSPGKCFRMRMSAQSRTLLVRRPVQLIWTCDMLYRLGWFPQWAHDNGPSVCSPSPANTQRT